MSRFALREIAAGAEETTGTSAEAYHLWYRIALPTGDEGWVQAAIPTPYDTGSDDRPSSVRLDLPPDVVEGMSGVQTGPGATTLTQIPFSAPS